MPLTTKSRTRVIKCQGMSFLADCSIRLLNYRAWIQSGAASGMNPDERWLSELEVLSAWRTRPAELSQKLGEG